MSSEFSITSHQCSSCGASLGLASDASIYIVCKYCNTAQLKKGASFETLGKVAELKEDFSVIQIGTQGMFNNSRFGVFGRIKLKWERGTWDEWYIVFEDSTIGWLAEAQGFYYISKPIEFNFSELNFPLPLDSAVYESNIAYKVKDIKKAVCIFSEGELPFNGAEGEVYESYDLFSSEGKFLSLSIVDEENLAFKGEAYSFKELSLSNLRALEGWSVNG